MDWLAWLFPKHCFGCDAYGEYICSDCLNQLQVMKGLYCPVCRKESLYGQTHPRCKKPFTIDGVLSCYRYSGLMKRLIGKFKYRFVKDLTDTLTELFVTEAQFPQLFKIDFTLVPIPLHPKRHRWRGFNQAELLSRALADSWGWPHQPNLLLRIKQTESQMKLSAAKRSHNLKGAFAVNKREPLPEAVLLIDDVATTCSTMLAAASVLKRAGVKTVWGLTLAQTNHL